MANTGKRVAGQPREEEADLEQLRREEADLKRECAELVEEVRRSIRQIGESNETRLREKGKALIWRITYAYTLGLISESTANALANRVIRSTKVRIDANTVLTRWQSLRGKIPSKTRLRFLEFLLKRRIRKRVKKTGRPYPRRTLRK